MPHSSVDPIADIHSRVITVGMHRNRFAHFASAAISIAALVIYIPVLFEISGDLGLWFSLPIWGCVLVGFVQTMTWIEVRLSGKQNPSVEVHNSNFPKPSVRASTWDESLIASNSSIDEAFETAKGRRYGVIGVVSEDGSEMILRWSRKGWRIELQPRGEAISKIAVKIGSRWADREIKTGNWLDSFLRRHPNEGFDDQTAKAVLGSWLRSDKMPPNVAWSTIRYA